MPEDITFLGGGGGEEDDDEQADMVYMAGSYNLLSPGP